MPKDNYTLAKVCYFITAMFAGFAAFAHFSSGRMALAVVWAILCAVFLFASHKMKVARDRAREVGMVDNSKSARAARKKEKAAELAAAAETAKSQIVDPGVTGDGDIASAVSASLYSAKGRKSEAEAKVEAKPEEKAEEQPEEKAGEEASEKE